jgi:C4-dicarboxylate transporter DctM subunit
MFFAAISGSGPATVAAIGGIMIPAMVREGYDKKFATSVVCAAGSLGVIIPPSIPMIIFGVVGETSVGDLFIAGILPGILVAIGLIIWAYIYSSKKGYKGKEKTSFSKFLKTGWEAKWALLIPVIILGGIYGGIFTPTEAAVVAVVYGVIAGAFLYKELNLKEIPNIIVDASLTTATILIILGMATGFGRLLTVEEIPGKIASAVTAFSESPTIILLLILLVLLIVGCFMETTAAIIILVPILLPIAVEAGMDPTHFGMIVVVGLAIGFITPPLGVNLFVGSGISGLRIETLSRAVMPFFIMMVIALLIISFIPQISLFLIELIR